MSTAITIELSVRKRTYRHQTVRSSGVTVTGIVAMNWHRELKTALNQIIIDSRPFERLFESLKL